MEGSSALLNNLDNIRFAVKFYNRISKCLSIITDGGDPYWDEGESRYIPLPQPIYSGFTGDGSICVFLEKDISVAPPLTLFNRIRNLVVHFDKVYRRCSNEMPGVELPRSIRFGIAPGTVSILKYIDDQERPYQIMAKCSNVASKLQLLCKQLGISFMASATIPGVSAKDLKRSHYRIITVRPRGMDEQRVIINEGGFIKIRDQLSPKDIHTISDEV
jgi:hypothetical protein